MCSTKDAMHEELTPRSPPILRPPLEIREIIYEMYLEDMRDELNKHVHFDRFDNPCCTWDLGKGLERNLIMCDKDTRTDPVPPATAPFFLPAIGLANKQIMGEVSRFMLRHTKTYVFKTYYRCDLKITRYFMDFLDAISTPDYNAFDHVLDVTLPHIYAEPVKGDEGNPAVALMVKCEKMRVVRLTFHGAYLVQHMDGKYRQVHMSLDSILGKYGLRPILDCKGLEEVYLTGIEPAQHMAGKLKLPKDCLKEVRKVGQWIKQGFEAKGKDVKVLYCKRRGAWSGEEEFSELQEEEEEEPVVAANEKITVTEENAHLFQW